MGRREITDLKARVGWECCISKRGLDRTVEIYQPEESEEEVTVLQ